MSNDIIKQHIFSISLIDLTNAIRPFLGQRFPINSRDVELLNLVRASLDMSDATKVL